MNMQAIVDSYNAFAHGKSVEEILRFVAQNHARTAVFTTSFGLEDQAITHIIFSSDLPIEVVTLDTGRLFKETYKVYSKTIEKYNKPIRAYYPNTQEVEELLTKKGPYSFYESVENRKECCTIRKVRPLNRALSGKELWITGIRADQSENRHDLHIFEYDKDRNLIKCNPLLHWSFEQLQEYVKQESRPYNLLHDKGFVSIGCEPCTRAIQPGEDFRAGRWWWEDNSKKECGLHTH